MISNDNSHLFRNKSNLNNGSSNILDNLYDFLKDAELQHYFEDLNLKLKVRSIAQLKYVDETDLQSIGMTRPEMKRLIKYFTKEYPQTAMGKIKKRLTRTISARSTSATRPDDLSNRISSNNLRFNTNVHLISPMNSDELTTIASVTNFSVASNGTNDSYDLRQFGSKYLIPHNHLIIGSLLRHGDFADIYKGDYFSRQATIQVVVKVINKVNLKEDVNDFVREMFTNCYLDHANVIKFYGICFDEYSIKMVYEVSLQGSLADCLMTHESKIKFPITILHSFCVQISDGMRYLEERRVIHGRLIISNVLSFLDNKIKITDVGLFRAQSSLERCNVTDKSAWLSPEVSKGHKETISSDVWAFGVLLWEIFSYCQHNSLTHLGESMSSLMDMKASILPQPDLCPNMIFNLMKICWIDLAKDRPSFYQLSSELARLEPKQVVSLVDGPDLIPSHRSDERNELSDDSYSSLTEMQMLYYKTGDVIVVLDRSINQYKELWKGCLLTGECGYFRWLNMRAVGVTEVILKSKKDNDNSSSSSITSNGCNIGEAFSKMHISRREDKKKQGRLTTDMISSPQNDFRHLGHMGADGEVFGDVTSLYTISQQSQKELISGYVSISSVCEANSVISSAAINATREGTPPYATIDTGLSNAKSNKSNDISKKKLKKDLKPIIQQQLVPPLPPIRSHSEEDTSIYLDSLAMFSSRNESFSLFDELAKQWEMQSAKLESPNCERKSATLISDESKCRKSSTLNEDYVKVFDEYQKCNKLNVSTQSVVKNVESRTIKAQRSVSVMLPNTTNGLNPLKTNIFQKFRALGGNKFSKTKDLSEGHNSPVYAKVDKSKKYKKNVISKPIIISVPMIDEGVDNNCLDCSGEVSSLQKSPRDSVLCLVNAANNSNDLTCRNSIITTNYKERSDSTITSVSPTSSLASLTSYSTSSILQNGTTLRNLINGDGIFSAALGVNASNKKSPPLTQICVNRNSNEGMVLRTQQATLPITKEVVTMSFSSTKYHNSLHTKVDNYETLDEFLRSSASTPDLSDLFYTDLSFPNRVLSANVNICEDDDSYNSLHSGSIGSDSTEPRHYQKFTNISDDDCAHHVFAHTHSPSHIVPKDELSISTYEPHLNVRLKPINRNYDYSSSNSLKMNIDNDEVAL